MFEKVLHENQDICKELLERLLKIQIDHIEYPEIEKTISPYYETKGVRLDVYIKDSDKVFDIELQNATDEDLPLRTRFYQSMLDCDNLLKGQDYSELPTSFVIFICKYDPFNLNLPIYTFQNRCNENHDLLLCDKSLASWLMPFKLLIFVFISSLFKSFLKKALIKKSFITPKSLHKDI